MSDPTQAKLVDLQHGETRYRFVVESRIHKLRALALAKYLGFDIDPENYDLNYIQRWTEPDTLNWIRSFKPDELFFDVGANIGMFTVFAAITSGVRVRSFEPSVNEAWVLNRNVFVNGLSSQVSTYGGCGISNEEGFDPLYMRKFNEFDGNFVGEEKNDYLEKVPTEFRQGCFKTTIDRLIFDHNMGRPDHIKIDVDGIEHLVVEGASQTLRERIPKSINLEVNALLDQHMEMMKTIKDFGYELQDTEDFEKLKAVENRSDAICNVFFYRQ